MNPKMQLSENWKQNEKLLQAGWTRASSISPVKRANNSVGTNTTRLL